MLIIPAVDIKGGKCVRLYQGDPDKESVYYENPIDAALLWQSRGAVMLHVVDLDAALTGDPVNREYVEKIIATLSVPVQVAGGLRDTSIMGEYFEAGAARVVAGTSAYRSEGFIQDAVREFGDRVIFAIDARDGLLVGEGWKSATRYPARDFAVRLGELGASTAIYTDTARDGALSGPNLAATKEILGLVDYGIIAAGGISRVGDVEALRKLECDGLVGMIIGKALYDGALNLEDIL